MIGLLSAGKNKKNISVRYLLLTIFVCISMVAWLGISDLRADGNDPEPNSDEFEEGFQNITEEQRVENIAHEAAKHEAAKQEAMEILKAKPDIEGLKKFLESLD